MVFRELYQQLDRSDLKLKVIISILPTDEMIYNVFRQELIDFEDELQNFKGGEYPTTWDLRSNSQQILVTVPINSTEYNKVTCRFIERISHKCTQVVKLERVQNRRWYKQYRAHAEDFQRRLKENTERILYHGCSGDLTQKIAEEGLLRNFAGKNGMKHRHHIFSKKKNHAVCFIQGIAYGVGVYFSSDPKYSHNYSHPNSQGERSMFVVRVLVGKTTQGNSTMKIPPLGFDSTTDGNHIFVTYHDAQAFAEYLITYK